MPQDSDNVILFPTWQKNLEQESLDAMREKKYEEALEKINQLLHFNVENHELYIAKLICLMELRDHRGALDLSEEMLAHKDENYFQYVHIYLTVLFQMGYYEQLIDQVHYEFSEHHVPPNLAEQFEKLEEASRSLYEEVKIHQGVEYIQGFKKAIKDRAFQRQWHIIMQMRKNETNMHPEMIDLLASDDIHPMIQTGIFMCLQDQTYGDEVKVRKLGMQATFIPSLTPSIERDTHIQTIERLLEDVEQENPVLYQLMQQMIHRYAYVRHPFSFEEEQLPMIASSIRMLASSIFNDQEPTYEEPMSEHIIEEIEMSISLYLSVIEES